MSTVRTLIRKSAALGLAGLLALSLPAQADQTDRIVFDVILKGVTAGQLSINGKIEGASYGATGTLQTTGLVGMLKKLRHDAAVSGSFRAGRFSPLKYSETAQRNGKVIDHGIIYKAGTPVSVTRNPPRTPGARDVEPANQGGTIDPLTALYAVLRDVDRAEACTLDVKMYDGSKRSQVRLEAPAAAGDGVVCKGEYRRLEGFSPEDMAEKSRFPFTLTYAPTPDGTRLQVIEISTDTILGQGRLKRR